MIVAGRSLERAGELAARLQKGARAKITPACLDATQVAAADLAALRPLLVINASGPYQLQDYRLPRACIAAGAHYADLADARGFVTGIGALDAEARDAGVLVASGASTVPAISAAVIDEHAPQFAALEAATIVIAPGNSFDPGLATTQSILGSLGRPIAASRGGTAAAPSTHGWQDLRRRVIPGLGARWLGACDTPDLDLLPRRYPGLRRVKVFAALEVGAFHLGLWGLSWLVRGGLVRNPERLAAPLLRVKHALGFLGSDVGGMAVTLEGKGKDGAPMRRRLAPDCQERSWSVCPGHAIGDSCKAAACGHAGRSAAPCRVSASSHWREFLSEVADLDMTAGSA